MSSQFNYRHLDEEVVPDTTHTRNINTNHVETLTSLTDETTQSSPQNHGADLSEEINRHSGHCYDNGDTHKQPNVKYTALKPTSPPQEVPYSEDEESYSGERLDSVIQLRLASAAEKRRCSRVNTAICILLCMFASLVIFAIIYVFVIFPSQNGKIKYSDGNMHMEDLARLRKLGDTVTITSCGLVRGTHEKDAYVFKGIPYGTPPIGSRRWKAPLQMSYHTNSCWDGVINATHYGEKCVQPLYNDTNAIEGSEDCLFLNVWTPSLAPDGLLPVLVWLHSGDFIHGSGHMPGMSPSPEIAVATNAVYVSMNYRLGALGFLALDVLRNNYRGPTGNYGIMDQLLALHWVKENIRHFGGNELDVTIFGHGSGATSVQALLQSSHSLGLFNRAWMASPTAILNKTLNEACKDNEKFLTRTGCSSASCLRSLSPLKITKASPWSLVPYWTIDEIFHVPYHSQVRNDLAIFDGEVVHWSLSDVGPLGVDVPVILGTTYFELSNLKTESSVVNLTEDRYNSLLIDQAAPLGTDAIIEIKKLYSDVSRLHYTSPAHFPPIPSASFSHLIGDVKNVCPMKILSDSLNYLYSSPVYMYTAEIYPSHNILLSTSDINSFVGWDMVAFFNGFANLNFVPGQGDLNFMLLMRAEIMSFIKKGKPSAARWKSVDQSYGIIGRGITVSSAPPEYFQKCALWKRYGYFSYTWDAKTSTTTTTATTSTT